jgi:hypothetical protein
MKIALLLNYPLVDRVAWKRILVEGLRADGHTVHVHYGKTSPLDPLQTFLKARRSGAGPVASGAKSMTGRAPFNYLHFRRGDVPVFLHRNLDQPSAFSRIAAERYDHHVTALDQILSKAFLAAVPSLLNVHYGFLPAIKGADSIAWSLLMTGALGITLHRLAEAVDTGDIIFVQPIDTDESRTLADARAAVHHAIPDLYLRFFRGELGGSFGNKGGQLYTSMHPDLRAIATDLLRPQST